MDTKKKYTFKSLLIKTELHHQLLVPNDLIKKLNINGRVRVNGTINGFDFNLAIQKTKENLHYIFIGRKTIKDAKLIVNKEYEVSFTLAEINELKLPETLEMILEQEKAYQSAWNNITIGLKRSLCIYINGTNNIDLQIKRATEILNKALRGEYRSKTKN